MGSTDTTERGDLARVAIAATRLAATGLAAAVVVAFIPVWPCPLVSHFPVQLAAVGLVVVAGAAALRVRGYVDLAAVATLVNLLWIAPDLCSTPRPVPSSGVPLRVLVFNVHTQSGHFAEARRLIEDLHPDVIGLVEVDRRWLEALAPALAGYTGRLESPRDDNFGVALYTRVPLDGAIEHFASDVPSAVAHLTEAGAEVNLVLVHPPPPISARALAAQVDQLDAVAERVHGMPGAVIVMGDLNATPWSQPFRRLVVRSGLCDSRAGFGISASYPADSTVLRIPIDHVLVTCSIGVTDRRVERDVGSDHRPVIADLAIPR
jgi:endonuclease/exonuclease/phosphatase (EEP) superfamily protein YafD